MSSELIPHIKDRRTDRQQTLRYLVDRALLLLVLLMVVQNVEWQNIHVNLIMHVSDALLLFLFIQARARYGKHPGECG